MPLSSVTCHPKPFTQNKLLVKCVPGQTWLCQILTRGTVKLLEPIVNKCRGLPKAHFRAAITHNLAAGLMKTPDILPTRLPLDKGSLWWLPSSLLSQHSQSHVTSSVLPQQFIVYSDNDYRVTYSIYELKNSLNKMHKQNVIAFNQIAKFWKSD